MLRTLAARGGVAAASAAARRAPPAATAAPQWRVAVAAFHNYGAVFNAPPERRSKDGGDFLSAVALRQHDQACREARFQQRAAKHAYYVKGTQRRYRMAKGNEQRASLRAIARDIHRINESYEDE